MHHNTRLIFLGLVENLFLQVNIIQTSTRCVELHVKALGKASSSARNKPAKSLVQMSFLAHFKLHAEASEFRGRREGVPLIDHPHPACAATSLLRQLPLERRIGRRYPEESLTKHKPKIIIKKKKQTQKTNPNKQNQTNTKPKSHHDKEGA